jgi:YaiO family outer membrane protein
MKIIHISKALMLFGLSCVLCCTLATAQSSRGSSVAPGSSLPGLGAVGMIMDGPGYIEVGGSHSALTAGNPDWNDFYARGMLSGGRNIFTGELTHESRFGDSGWFGDLGITRTLSENWYAQLSAGGSAGGFFLPKFRTDAHISRKLLRRRQLVASVGGGYDQSRTIAHDWRAQVEGAYYFNYPVVLQSGVMWTHATPGNILARTQYVAASQGHDKEHFVSLRYEWGREGYEVIGRFTSVSPVIGGHIAFTPPNVLFDFPVRTITGTWRQWIGPNWGLNFNVEHHEETAYHRLGGTVGVFLDF